MVSAAAISDDDHVRAVNQPPIRTAAVASPISICRPTARSIMSIVGVIDPDDDPPIAITGIRQDEPGQ
jgi:hypothetical protein